MKTPQKSGLNSAVKPLPKSVVKRAQRGNLKALKALLRQQLRRRPEGRNLRLQLARKNSILLIYLRGAHEPRRTATLAWMKPFFAKFPLPNVTGVRILGYREGTQPPLWVEQIPVSPAVPRLRVTPPLVGFGLAGVAFLVVVWGIAAMVRGPAEQVAQSDASSRLVSQEETESKGGSEESAADGRSNAQGSTAGADLSSADAEVKYKVIREEIFDGKRIQIDTDDPDLSRDECIAIAAQFLEEAGTDGKVVVQKPNPKPPWNGKRAPFCANNNNGYGTFFNSEYF